MNYLRILDQFSKKPELLINGHPRYFNKLGIFFGISLIISLVISVIIAINSTLNKKKINMLYNVESNLENFIEFNDIQISLIITNDKGNEIKNPDRLFEIQSKFLDFETVNGVLKPKAKPIFFSDCENNYKKTGDYNDSKLINAYKGVRCLKLKEQNITLHGNNRPGNHFSSFDLYLNKCVNTTSKTDCFPNEIIEEELHEVKLLLNIGDFDVNTIKNGDPFVPIRRGYNMEFSSEVSRSYYYGINYIEFFSDDDIIFEYNKKYTGYRIDSSWESVKHEHGNEFFQTTFGKISFLGSGKKEIYNRSYKKLIDHIPEIVAIYHIYMIFIKLLTIFLTDNSLEEYFFSFVFNSKEFKKFKESKETVNYEDIIKYELSSIKKEKNENINMRLDIENIKKNNENDNQKLKRNNNINGNIKIKSKSLMVKKFQNKDESSFNKNENTYKNKNSKFSFINNRILSKKFKEEEIKEENKSQNLNLNSINPLQPMKK